MFLFNGDVLWFLKFYLTAIIVREFLYYFHLINVGEYVRGTEEDNYHAASCYEEENQKLYSIDYWCDIFPLLSYLKWKEQH